MGGCVQACLPVAAASAGASCTTLTQEASRSNYYFGSRSAHHDNVINFGRRVFVFRVFFVLVSKADAAGCVGVPLREGAHWGMARWFSL